MRQEVLFALKVAWVGLLIAWDRVVRESTGWQTVSEVDGDSDMAAHLPTLCGEGLSKGTVASVNTFVRES